MDSNKIEKYEGNITLFSQGNFHDSFIPWRKGERGRQTYIKLQKNDESAYLYAGAGSVMQAEIQKNLMRLVNDGWSVEGDVHISFDGAPDEASDRLLCRHEITVEIGLALLPLVDPMQGAPLIEKLNLIREDLAKHLGFLMPGINVKDNMELQPNCYVIKLRESPKASNEVYIDRLLAIGDRDNLGKLSGWAVTEPTYRVPAKWIEYKDKELAESSNCMVQGPLNVLLTHISRIIATHAENVLGLQEVYDLLTALSETHPVLTDEFTSNIKNLRMVRKILQGLLREQVSLTDLVTILETIGEHMDELSNTPQMINHVRNALSSQICWSLLEADGLLRAVTINSELEKQLKSLVTDALGGSFMDLTSEQGHKLLDLVKELCESLEIKPVLLTDPAIRMHMSAFLSENNLPMRVLSVNEISPETKIIFIGEIKGSIMTSPDKKTAKKKNGDKMFWAQKLGKGKE